MKIGIFLPFFFDGIALFSVSIVVFGIFECFVHIMGIKILAKKQIQRMRERKQSA